MQKFAKSTDPVQQELRDSKKSWNKNVSAFIDDLIQFKKLMNGHASKFDSKKSFIKEPIPADPATIIGVLAGDFQDMAREANSVIEKQISYSKNRRKKLVPSSNSNYTNNANQLELALSNYEYALEALGSGKLSRFWSKIKTPTFDFPFSSSDRKEKIRRGRFKISFLNALADLKSDFKNLQEHILDSGEESLQKANKLLLKIEKDFNIFVTETSFFFSSLKDQELPTQDIAETKPEKQTDSKQKDFSEVNKAIEDLKLNKNNFSIEKRKLSSIFGDFENLNSPSYSGDKEELADKILANYQDIVNSFNQEFNLNERSLSDIITKKAFAVTQLVSEAFVSKMLKRTKHKLNLTGKESAIRLDMDDLASKAIKEIDGCLDSLENDIDFDTIKKMVIIVDNNIKAIGHLLKSMTYDKNGKLNLDFFSSKNYDLENALRQKNYAEYQQEQINKMVSQRITRDIANKYDNISENMSGRFSLLNDKK